MLICTKGTGIDFCTTLMFIRLLNNEMHIDHRSSRARDPPEPSPKASSFPDGMRIALASDKTHGAVLHSMEYVQATFQIRSSTA